MIEKNICPVYGTEEIQKMNKTVPSRNLMKYISLFSRPDSPAFVDVPGLPDAVAVAPSHGPGH